MASGASIGTRTAWTWKRGSISTRAACACAKSIRRAISAPISKTWISRERVIARRKALHWCPAALGNGAPHAIADPATLPRIDLPHPRHVVHVVAADGGTTDDPPRAPGAH